MSASRADLGAQYWPSIQNPISHNIKKEFITQQQTPIRPLVKSQMNRHERQNNAGIVAGKGVLDNKRKKETDVYGRVF